MEIAAAAIVHAAENMASATALEKTPNTNRQTAPVTTYNGVPGGCGMPSVSTAEMSSPASQSVTAGASVAP